MPSIDVIQPPAEKEESAPSTQPVVGIIYPPPEVRNIVDKTASFVARNGPEFESRIRQNELGNPKFNFLNSGDPYHAYYQHKVKEIKEGRANEPAPPGSGPPPQKAVTAATHLKQQELLKQIAEQPFIPKDPPPELEFTADPPSISALDLDIVKLTAQFVARNGRQFLTNLMNREQRNYQFDFLRPQHSLFQYFTKLLEQYTKVLIPPKDLMGRLKEEAANNNGVLDQVRYRADWIRHQEIQRRKEEQALEKERVAYAQIDWHDFVVVETVDYIPGEMGSFPPPTTPDEVGARVLMQERMLDHNEEGTEMQIGSEGEEEGEVHSEEEDNEPSGEKGASDNTQVQDMEEESSSEGEDDRDNDKSGTSVGQKVDGKRGLQPPPLPPAPDKVIVRKGYNPKQGAKASKTGDEYLISPITGGKIPASKVQEHMRIQLLDPRWVEQRDKHLQDRINQESVYAGGSAIEASLKQLAERRTDIFGVGDEETAIGKKIGEEDKKKDDKVTWDGHTSSVEAATRAARANITIEEQIHQIHKVKGLLPDEEKEKIGPKPVSSAMGGSGVGGPAGKPPVGPPPVPPVSSNPASITSVPTPVAAPPLPPTKPPVPPLPPVAAAPLPPPPGILPPPQPPIMMVPAPIRPPLMVPGAFPVVTAGPPAFMAPPGTTPLPPQPTQPPPPQLGGLTLKTGVNPGDPGNDDEPPPKKQKTEESLIPEAQFLAQNKGPISFKVLVPLMADKPEWRLNGQPINLVMHLSENIAAMKAKIHESTGMPPGKQKLQWEGMFFKDSNTLAYYNITSSTVVQLQLKERGGRKK